MSLDLVISVCAVLRKGLHGHKTRIVNQNLQAELWKRC
jgi:hypothetical protein